jgi:putative Mg2+ transporter-C (MgtC) family protein
MKGDIMNEIIAFLRDFNIWTVLIRLTLCVLVGGIIGVERGRQGRAAGMRTHILVCMGAALVTMMGFYITQELQLDGDPMRIAAQVVSGIGFLGVGTIMLKGRFQITGLTTAAGLWCAATIGLALGAGFYEGALGVFIFTIATVSFLHKLEYKFIKRYRRFGIYVEITSDKLVRTTIDEISGMFNITDIQVTLPRSGTSGNVGIEINVHTKNETPEQVSADIEKLDQVIFAIESI